MELSRIKELKKVSKAERLSMNELIEIEEAFNLIPDDKLRDLRENAMADDMLEELETHNNGYCLQTHKKNEKEELKRMVHALGVRTIVNLLATAIEELTETNTVYLNSIEPDERLDKEDIKTIVANLREDLF